MLNFVILSIVLSFVISLLPWGYYVLYPFRLFTTWAHECSHAVMAICMGGEVQKITLAPDTSGLTYFKLPKGRLRYSLVASAGYLGSCATGCLIYSSSAATTLHSPFLITAIGVTMLLTVVIWMRNFFAVMTVLLLGLGMIYLGQHPPQTSAFHYVLPFLGIQTGLNSLLDLKVLFGVKAKSDAHTMQSLFWLPAAFWAILWIALSVTLMGWTISRSLNASDRDFIHRVSPEQLKMQRLKGLKK